MTQDEYNEAAALVVRLRKELEHTNQHLVAHIDALTKSNAQCGEYLRQNEQLRAELATTRVAAASLERIQATAAKWGASGQEDAGHFIERTATDLDFMRLAKNEMQKNLAETTKDVADLRLAVDTMFSADKERLHSELVEVRAALASVSAERDSLKRTLKEWEEAETKPQQRIDPPIRMGLISETGPAVFVRIGAPPTDDIADHVVPPLPLCMKCHHCGNALDASVFGPYNVCTTIGCPRTVTNNDDGEDKSPYNGPCTSSHPVRHE